MYHPGGATNGDVLIPWNVDIEGNGGLPISYPANKFIARHYIPQMMVLI